MKQPRMISQFFQHHWPQGQSGFYVEIGAWNGYKKNSTKLLEDAGWDGVCVEPTPTSFAELVKNRRCRCLNVAVFDHVGEMEFAVFADRPEWNGILKTFDMAHAKKTQEKYNQTLEIIRVPCVTWQQLELPSHIDYLQVDVEGAELQILNTVPWNSVNIDWICLEDNASMSGDLTYRNYMKDLGYEIVRNDRQDYLYRRCVTVY